MDLSGLPGEIGGMKKPFPERDCTKAGYFQSVLEAAGIPIIVRNRHLTMSGLTEIPIPDFSRLSV